MARSKAKTSPPRSNLIARWLAISFAATLGPILILMATHVRLGEGYFAYRYSPIRETRTVRAIPILLIALLAIAGIFWLSRRRSLGYFPLTLALLATTLWLWWAPPNPTEQHAFNLRSLSSDGAFVFEAEGIRNLPNYLRRFDQRLKFPPAQMGGTRILSNPPGMTAFSYAVIHAFPPQTHPLAGIEQILVHDYQIHPDNVAVVSNSLKVAGALCVTWTAATIVAFFLGRLFLSPAGAALFAIITCFNPCTVHFVPGKDPAQLLTINLMLLAWFAGWRWRQPWWCIIAGATVVIGATVGLIHLWIAAAIVIATSWEALRSNNLRLLLFTTSAAALGAIVVMAIAQFTIAWNIPSQLLAVWQRFSELQRTFDMSRPIWVAIGLPIFLLFLSPGFWTLIGLRAHHRRMSFGARIALCTGAVMLFTYLLGVTYELPRLWVAFLPPLTLGLSIDLPMLRIPRFHKKLAQALVLIAAVQVLYTSMHWTIFDVRESEYRLLSKRYYK